MLRTCLQFTALILTLESAIFLAWGNLGLSGETIVEITITKWAEYPNESFIKSLAGQRGDTWTGVILLMSAFLVQMLNLCWPMGWDKFKVNKTGIILALMIGGLVFIGSLILSNHIALNTYNDAIKVHSQRYGRNK